MSDDRIPKYRRQRGSNGDRAFVALDGVRYCLGAYGSPENHESCRTFVAEWLHDARQHPVAVCASTIAGK